VNDLLYYIKGLNCTYKKLVPPVLIIEELKIIKGSRVFFIGPSGVGKSTILESLGLMNNTIKFHNDNAVFNVFYDLEEGSVKTECLLSIWNKGEKKLSDLRNKIFSFIFQSNNLFSSMSGYQNIISGAIINGMDSLNAREKASELVSKLLPDLNLNDNDKDFNILEMSGGQRQRVSFSRAIIANKPILFADEPTGNLDWYNADNVMNDLHNNMGKDGTSIVVTHDIDLALKFATQIVMISKQKCKDRDGKDHYYGAINNSTVYNKKDIIWENDSVKKAEKEVREELRSMFIPKDF